LADFTLEELDGLNKDFSMGCWIKINKQEILSHFSTISSSATVPTGSILGYNHYGGISLTWYADGLSSFNNIGVRGSLRGTSPSYVFGGTYNLPFDKWVHLILVKDTKNQKLTLYVDGVQKASDGTTVINSITNTTQNFGINRPSVYSGNGPQTTLPMRISDVRVYDHALGQAEVKELSKALVVHYTFDDTLAEPTTNIISGIQSVHGNSSLESGRVKINWSPSGGDTYFMFNCTQTIKANNVYTLSFDCEGLKPGEVATFAVSNLGSDYTVALKNGRNSLTFTAGSDLMNDINTYNRLFFDDKTRTDGAVFYLSNFQLEEKDHATPYTSASHVGKLCNETGLTQPDISDNVNLTTDSKSGTLALKCQGNTQIICTDIGDTTQGVTASFWVKCSIPSDSRLVFADNNSKIAFGFFNNGQAIITCAGYAHACVSNIRTNWNADWNHIIVRKTSNGVVECYINGVKQSLSGSQEWTHSSINSLSIGCRYSGGWTSHLTGLIDDFRLYHTCLTDNDIASLYKTKAYITDKGGITCGEFVEDKPATKVTKKSTFECKEMYEEIDPAYERLDYTNAPYNSSSVNTCPHIDTGIPASTKIRRLETLHYLNSSKTSQIMFGNNGLYCFYREWNDPRPNYGVIAGGSGYIQTSIVMQPALVYATCDIRANKTIELYVH
jgi:hypothetical protein